MRQRTLSRFVGFGLLPLVFGCSTPEAPSAARRLENPPLVSGEAHVQPTATAAPVPRASKVVLLAGGDVSFGRDTGQRLLRDASFDPFLKLRPLLSTADVRFANLESPLSDQGGETRHPEKPLVFTGPPAGARVLKQAGFDVVSLANNHVWDYGVRGFSDTLQHLEEQGIRYTGAGRTQEVRDAPAVLRVSGWSIAFLAATDVWNPGSPERHAGNQHVLFANISRVVELVREAQAAHDLVIVSYHGGKEYSEHIAREARDFARAVMQAGADAIIGHHPHVPQGVEWFDGRPALYSLGNLVFEKHKSHPWTARSFMARLTFADQRSPELEFCGYQIDAGNPTPLTDAPLASRHAFHLHARRVALNADFTEVATPDAMGCMRLKPTRAAASL